MVWPLKSTIRYSQTLFALAIQPHCSLRDAAGNAAFVLVKNVSGDFVLFDGLAIDLYCCHYCI